MSLKTASVFLVALMPPVHPFLTILLASAARLYSDSSQLVLCSSQS